MSELRRADASEKELGIEAVKAANAVVLFAWIIAAVAAIVIGCVAGNGAREGDGIFTGCIAATFAFLPAMLFPVTARAWMLDMKRRHLFMDRN